MSDNFNKLTPKQTEILTCIAEECSELIHIICKTLRHGLDNYDPTKPTKITNQTQITNEIGDLCKTIDLAFKNRIISAIKVSGAYSKPKSTIYFHHLNDME